MHAFTLANPGQIRGDQLVHEILQATGVNVRPAYGYEPPQTVTLALDLTAGQVWAIEQVIAGHVPDPLYFEADRDEQARRERLAGARARWLASQLAGNTPEEAYGLIERALTGASTVAGMRQVLIQPLPVIEAGVVYLARQLEE